MGSRTGLRLSAVAIDQDGFEDLEAFYKASQAALDNGQQPENEDQDDEDEDDYDSFDETRFSRRPGSGMRGRHSQVASSSSAMDIQNSSAPSPSALLRSSRKSAPSTKSPGRNSKASMTLADDDDDDDLDLPNLSTASRSFDLGASAADDQQDYDEAPSTPSAPAKGLSARQKGGASASSPKAKAKGKAAPATRRIELLSDSEDDGILAHLQQRLNSAYDDGDQDMGAQSDHDITPVRSSPAKRKASSSASNPSSPQRTKAKSAAKKRSAAAAEEEDPAAISQPSGQKPAASTSQAAHSPKRTAGRSVKHRVAELEPEAEPLYGQGYDESEPAYLPPQPSPPPPEPAQPPKRKRGRPPKSQTAQQPSYDDSEAASTRPSQKSKPSTNGTGRSSASTSKAKTSKSSARSKTKQKATGEVVEKVRPQAPVATVYDENGVRRSTRQRFAPLEYWRGERIRYGRPSLPSGTTVDDFRRSQRPGEDEFEDDPSMMLMRKRVPVLDIKEVIRVPRAPGEGTFAGTTRPRTTSSRRKAERKGEDVHIGFFSHTPTPDPDEDGWLALDPTADTLHVENGWDAKTVETGIVLDDEDGTEVETSIVRTKASLRPIAAANQEFRFEKLFNCGGLMATGILELPPGTRKPTKPSKDNSFVFCVLQGALRATVHRKEFVVGPEGIFQVPAGNTYSLENICQRDVKLFFAQCRKTKKANAGDLTTFTQMSDTSYGTPHMATSRPVLDELVRANARGHQSRIGEDGRSEGEEEVLHRWQRAMPTSVVVPNPSLPSTDVPKSKTAKQTVAPTHARATAMTADSDQDDSEPDDFETSRQVKTKKRIFRKV